MLQIELRSCPSPPWITSQCLLIASGMRLTLLTQSASPTQAGPACLATSSLTTLSCPDTAARLASLPFFAEPSAFPVRIDAHAIPSAGSAYPSHLSAGLTSSNTPSLTVLLQSPHLHCAAKLPLRNSKSALTLFAYWFYSPSAQPPFPTPFPLSTHKLNLH